MIVSLIANSVTIFCTAILTYITFNTAHYKIDGCVFAAPTIGGFLFLRLAVGYVVHKWSKVSTTSSWGGFKPYGVVLGSILILALCLPSL